MNGIGTAVEQAGHVGALTRTLAGERRPAWAEPIRPGYAGWPAPPLGRPQTARLLLPAEPASACPARDFVSKSLADWGMDDLVDDTVMVVSELVTNVIKHATPRPFLTDQSIVMQVILIHHPGRLTLMVADPDDTPPAPVRSPKNGDHPLLSEHGHGLHIVGALATGWGWAPLAAGGKAVWAVFTQRV